MNDDEKVRRESMAVAVEGAIKQFKNERSGDVEEILSKMGIRTADQEQDHHDKIVRLSRDLLDPSLEDEKLAHQARSLIENMLNDAAAWRERYSTETRLELSVAAAKASRAFKEMAQSVDTVSDLVACNYARCWHSAQAHTMSVVQERLIYQVGFTRWNDTPLTLVSDIIAAFEREISRSISST